MALLKVFMYFLFNLQLKILFNYYLNDLTWKLYKIKFCSMTDFGVFKKGVLENYLESRV